MPDEEENEAHLKANYLANCARFEEANKYFQKAIQQCPDDPVIHNDFGVSLDAQGKHTEALEQYSESLRIEPDYQTALYNKANTYTFIGKITDALKVFEDILELDPDNLDVQYERAIILISIN